MKIRDREITLPTSMIGTYSHPLYIGRFFWHAACGGEEERSLGDTPKPPPEAAPPGPRFQTTYLHARIHADSYAEQTDYDNYKRIGDDPRGGILGFPIFREIETIVAKQRIIR